VAVEKVAGSFHFLGDIGGVSMEAVAGAEFDQAMGAVRRIGPGRSEAGSSCSPHGRRAASVEVVVDLGERETEPRVARSVSGLRRAEADEVVQKDAVAAGWTCAFVALTSRVAPSRICLQGWTGSPPHWISAYKSVS
jgi:hypothetical protein